MKEVQVVLSEESAKVLAEVKRLTCVEQEPLIFIRALAVYHRFLKELDKGAEVIVVHEDEAVEIAFDSEAITRDEMPLPPPKGEQH